MGAAVGLAAGFDGGGTPGLIHILGKQVQGEEARPAAIFNEADSLVEEAGAIGGGLVEA